MMNRKWRRSAHQIAYYELQRSVELSGNDRMWEDQSVQFPGNFSSTQNKPHSAAINSRYLANEKSI